MAIELRGIIQFKSGGHTKVDLLVTNGASDNYERSLLGVDVKVNRGTILKFLSEKYGVPAGDIVWPAHIKIKAGPA